MRIFLMETSAVTKEAVEQLAQTLPPWRRAIANRCRQEAAYRQSVLAFCLARFGIRQEDAHANTEDWTHRENGKPYLQAGDPFFNLSHTAHGIAVAVSGQEEVGIDIEEIRPHHPRLVSRICNAAEQAIVTHAPDPVSELVRLWSAKEAVVKQSGIGMGKADLPHIPTNGVQNIHLCFGGIPHWLSVFPASSAPRTEWVSAEMLFTT